MGVLFWIFTFFFGIYLTFRIFGKQIMQFTLNRVARKLMKDAQKASQNYERNYSEGSMRNNLYVDEEIKVSAPNSSAKRQVTADEIAEDIEFEELN